MNSACLSAFAINQKKKGLIFEQNQGGAATGTQLLLLDAWIKFVHELCISINFSFVDLYFGLYESVQNL